MSEIIQIQKKIPLHSKFLTSDYLSDLFRIAKETFENECSKDYGYILEVKKIVKVVDNYISPVDGSNMFLIILEVVVIKPEIDKVFVDKICMIFNGGIFVNVYDKIKVLIPSNSLTKYKFDSMNKEFINIDNDKLRYRQEDLIKIKINGVKYTQKQFACFGEII
jgi:DNA-directed RNA polymerase subunit E'/Rpb7